MISIDALAVEFGNTTLFKDISFAINPKDRIALMGKNGAGKSTLLKIIAGVKSASRGKVSSPKDTVIAYLPQHLMTDDSRTVFEEASQAFADIKNMELEMEELNNQLSSRTDYESEEYYEIIERVSTLSEKFYSTEEVKNPIGIRVCPRRFHPPNFRIQWWMAHAHRIGENFVTKTGFDLTR